MPGFWNWLRYLLLCYSWQEWGPWNWNYLQNTSTTILCKVLHTKTLTGRFLPSLEQTSFSRIMLILLALFTPSVTRINQHSTSRSRPAMCVQWRFERFHEAPSSSIEYLLFANNCDIEASSEYASHVPLKLLQ